jgi:hypothetical protein
MTVNGEFKCTLPKHASYRRWRVVQRRSRDLVLLKAIEKTLAQLDEDMVQLQMANAAAERFISILRDKDIEVRLDNSVDLGSIFEQARDHIGQYHEMISRCHISAASDTQLSTMRMNRRRVLVFGGRGQNCIIS